MTGEVGRPSIEARPDARPVPLVVWAARLSVYFLLQGSLLLVAYTYYGFDTDPQSFPPGQRLDPLHAAVHLLWGLAGTYVGFVRPPVGILPCDRSSGQGTCPPSAVRCGRAALLIQIKQIRARFF